MEHMEKKKRAIGVAAILAVCLLFIVVFREATLSDCDIPLAGSPGLTDRIIREQGLSAVDSSTQGHRSMFVWEDYFFTAGAIPALSELLTDFQIDRVYQSIYPAYFQRQELADLVQALTVEQGIQVVALNGDNRWVEEGLEEYKYWIDGLHRYNQNHPEQQITAVALDVEAHTLEAFKRDPDACFAEYCLRMEEAYQYANSLGLQVIQIIPTRLDTIDQEQFEWFLEHCCDEISLMNYLKCTALSAIWNEVETCRRLGVPVETIFETMPVNKKHGVTKDITYFYEGTEALASAVREMQEIYGTSLSIGYHHYETMYHMQTGQYLARVYPYAKADADGDGNGQMTAGERISLQSRDGDTVSAWLTPPNNGSSTGEFSYLAVGVDTNTKYTVHPDSEHYDTASSRPVRFKEKAGKLAYADAFYVELADGNQE